jgi:peptidyl-prolyl cis-trans isomerase B (cyclophilin B)
MSVFTTIAHDHKPSHGSDSRWNQGATMPRATIHTDRGDIHLDLFDQAAPKTVDNFVKLAEDGFYDGLAFHRVIPGFMAQGGCPNTREDASGRPGTGGPGYHIPCELKDNPERHTPGTLSMAHAGRNTGGSQFFITHAATPHLDGEHTVFGRVVGQQDLDAAKNIAQGDRFTVTIHTD